MSDKYVALSSLSIYHTWKNMTKLYKNCKFKISGQTQNEKFELSDASYSLSDTQDYLKYIIKTHEKVGDDPSIKIYVNKVEFRITFKT